MNRFFPATIRGRPNDCEHGRLGETSARPVRCEGARYRAKARPGPLVGQPVRASTRGSLRTPRSRTARACSRVENEHQAMVLRN